MADVISFGTFETAQTLINEGNAAVSGMSAAEAVAAMGAEANSGLYVYNAVTGAGASNVTNFPNAASAAEAAAEFISQGGTTAASGAATAATGAAEQAVNMAIGQTAGAQAATGVYGLLSMPLPTAAAALAPLAGVALGVGLYSAAPDFWEGLSRTLLPFCYDDSELLPALCDSNGNTMYSKAAIDAVKAYIESQGVGESQPVDYSQVDRSNLIYPDRTYTLYTIPQPVYTVNSYSGEITTLTVSGSAYAFWTSGPVFVYVSNSPFSVSRDVIPYTFTAVPYTHNGLIYYVAWASSNQEPVEGTYIASPLPNIDNSTLWDVAYLTLNGNVTPSFPDGVTKWEGNSYPSGTDPINVLTGYDQQGNPIYTPYYPVSTPIGDPGVSNDPHTNPNPAINPNPDPAINPYISPVPDPAKYPDTIRIPDPAPIPNPVPDPQPVPDPDRDPSRDPDPDEVPDDPDEPSGGKDTGDSTPPAIPLVPLTPASGASLLHVYNPTQAQIDAFGSWLWTTWSDASIWQTIQKLFNDPMDGIIGLHELYATPALNGSSTIRCGYMDSGVASALVGTRYTTINCGTIIVEEYYQNYLDYSPYTQVYVYLPFIGIMPLSADDIIGNAVNIKYHIDSYTGCCIALITVARSGYSSTVYQFEGNCAVEIPITSGYQSALMSGLLAVAGTAISGNPSVGLTAAHVGRAGLGKNAVQHSGSFGSSYGAMGVKIPYIIVRRPVQKKVNNYSLSYGYPAHKMVFVGNCQGYLRVREVRVMSTTATNVEKEMIVAALKEGVYVK